MDLSGKSLDELPLDCLIHIARFIPEEDIVNVAVLSHKCNNAIRSEQFCMAFFLQKFGPDYWGEYVELHPYKTSLIPKENNPFQDMTLNEITLSYSTNQGKSLQHLHDFAAINSWSSLLQRYRKMQKLWQKPCNSAYLISGLPKSGKTTVLNLIKKDPEFQLFEQIDSPSNVKIVHGQVPAFDMASRKQDTFWPVSLCEVSKPRNWFPRFRGSIAEYLYIIYVIDSIAFSTDPEYKKELYVEFHGMLGEAASSKYTSYLYLGDPQAAKQSEILEHLRVCPAGIRPGVFNCPYYAGPVIFCILGDVDLHTEKAEIMVNNVRKWLSRQPCTRPHWEDYGLILGRLVDIDPSRMRSHDVPKKTSY